MLSYAKDKQEVANIVRANKAKKNEKKARERERKENVYF